MNEEKKEISRILNLNEEQVNKELIKLNISPKEAVKNIKNLYNKAKRETPS